jgi:hypothetical protein
MNPVTKRLPSYTEVDEDQARKLRKPKTGLYTVEVNPPRNQEPDSTGEGFVRSILEIQTGLLGLKNHSPVVAYEIQRPRPGRIRLQFCVPTKRMERKIRLQLSNQIPGIRFKTGSSKLPVVPGDSIGGGILSTGREHCYPLQTEFDAPPVNNVVAGLHRHAMQDTKILVQILFQPVAGHSIKEWWRRRRSHKTIRYLRKEKEQLWGSRSPTSRERHQANLIEEKQGQRRFWTCIRFAVIGAEEHTSSRVKELAGGFNIFENPETGQYLNTTTIQGLRQRQFLEFYQAIRDRRFNGYSHRFQASVPELTGLVSIPNRTQKNIQYSDS